MHEIIVATVMMTAWHKHLDPLGVPYVPAEEQSKVWSDAEFFVRRFTSNHMRVGVARMITEKADKFLLRRSDK